MSLLDSRSNLSRLLVSTEFQLSLIVEHNVTQTHWSDGTWWFGSYASIYLCTGAAELKPCTYDSSNPLGEISFSGIAGAISGAVASFGDLEALLNVTAEVVAALEADQNYATKINECVEVTLRTN